MKPVPAQTPTGFEIFDVTTAEREARPTLESIQQSFGGQLPNLFGVLAGSAALLRANYVMMEEARTISLSPLEQQVVELASSFANECSYCLAAHRFLSQRLPGDPIKAAGSGAPVSDLKLEALRCFVMAMLASSGDPAPAVRAEFFRYYSPAQALEVILLLGIKTIHNYANNLAQTPIDPMFSG